MKLPHCVYAFALVISIMETMLGNDAFVSIIHEARLQWLQQNNFTEIDIAGTGLIMSDLAFEFKNESYYGEEIFIRLSAGEISRVSFDLYYQLTSIRNNETILIGQGKNRHGLLRLSK